MKAVDHGREHGVGRGKAPKQKGSAPAEGRARMRPGGFNARGVRLDLIVERDRLDRPAKIRWARLPQRDEPRVHFAGERAGVGASGFAFRPYRLFGMDLRKVFDDREQLPDHDLAVL